MLQPNYDRPDDFVWQSASGYSAASVSKQARATLDPSERDALLEALVPAGVSAAKRAVIERLITLSLTNQKLDVA